MGHGVHACKRLTSDGRQFSMRMCERLELIAAAAVSKIASCLQFPPFGYVLVQARLAKKTIEFGHFFNITNVFLGPSDTDIHDDVWRLRLPRSGTLAGGAILRP